MRYVALGDSYTIGTSVSQGERWPNQLVARLAAAARAEDDPAPLELVANLAVNGFTTEDVIAVELPPLAVLEPEVVSLQIGVNDIIRGIDEPRYGRNVQLILDAVAALVSVRLVFGVTTPDYTVTPAGADYGDPDVIAAAIARRNERFAAELERRGLTVIDVRAVSLLAATDRSLVARDGLHPSGDQYGLWVDRIEPALRAALQARLRP
jgi:lysophospholipase L1-like esterase